jgi:toluene monooxygenase electron transfer component
MTSYHIAIEDGAFISCGRDETILHALLRAGRGIAYECSSGVCGSCRFDLLGGQVSTIWHFAPGLNERDRKRGNRHLACQSRPESDCVVKIRLNDNYKSKVIPAVVQARVVGNRAVAAGMSELSLDTAGPAEFLPGQYMALELPNRGARRVYSMSNLPNPQGRLQFIIKRKSGGALSGFLVDQVSAGDLVTLSGPYGMAYLRDSVRRDILCVAGGSGLSPMLGIVRGALRSPELRNARVNLFYGGRACDDIVQPTAFADIASECGGRLSFHVAASEPDDKTWTGERGFIHDLVDRSFGPELKNFEIYVAGPPAMTRATLDMFARRNVPTDQIHCDDFG